MNVGNLGNITDWQECITEKGKDLQNFHFTMSTSSA